MQFKVYSFKFTVARSCEDSFLKQSHHKSTDCIDGQDPNLSTTADFCFIKGFDLRKFFLSILIIFFLSSCSQNNQNQFTISGTVKNANGKTIKLLSFGEQNNTPVLLDSCVVDKDGKYSLNTLSNYQELYLIKMDNSHLYWVINDSKKINLNFDYAKPRSNQVSKSVNSELLQNFISHFDSLYQQWKTKKTIQDSVLQKRVSDSLAVVVKSETNLALQKLQTLVNKTIINNESVALKQFCIFYGYKLEIIDVASAFNYTQSLFNEYANNPQVIVLYNQILEATKGNAEFLLAGKPAPTINTVGINGDTINLQNYKGKYVVIDFWASNNSNYRQQAPALTETYKQYRDTNFAIIGISVDSNILAMQKAIRVDSLKWKHIHDTLGLNGNLAKQYLVKNLPARYFINTEGNIVAINITVQQLKERLKEIYKR